MTAPIQHTIPARVTLCAIGYKVQVHEDMVVFASEPFGPCWTRLTFTRQAGCWYVSILSSREMAMVSHIQAAMELVQEWFGGNHCFANGEYSL